MQPNICGFLQNFVRAMFFSPFYLESRVERRMRQPAKAFHLDRFVASTLTSLHLPLTEVLFRVPRARHATKTLSFQLPYRHITSYCKDTFPPHFVFPPAPPSRPQQQHYFWVQYNGHCMYFWSVCVWGHACVRVYVCVCVLELMENNWLSKKKVKYVSHCGVFYII